LSIFRVAIYDPPDIEGFLQPHNKGLMYEKANHSLYGGGVYGKSTSPKPCALWEKGAMLGSTAWIPLKPTAKGFYLV